jgi:SPP1 family phage portal protein
MEIYFDNSATTPLCEAAKQGIINNMDVFGNPSSLHKKGFEAVDNDIVPYGVKVTTTEATGVEDVQPFVYSELPIVPLWGSTLHQSTLIGLRSQIDSYDLIRSGFANDLTDVAQIYWILENYGGVDDKELEKFLDRLKLNHIAEMDTSCGGKLTPYSQDIPFQARQAYLQHIRGEIYEGFGAFDTSAMSAAPKTATEIESAYQPLDENADDYEYQIIACVKALAKIIGVDPAKATPEFKRNRVANGSEMVEMLVALADILDVETIIDHIPFITVDEKDKVMQRIQEKELSRIEDEYDQTDLDEDVSSDGDIVDQISNMDTEYLQEFADEIISMLEGLANEV